MFAHFGIPTCAIAFNSVFEAFGKDGRVEIFGPSFVLEEWSDLRERQPGFFCEPDQVVKVSAQDTLYDTTKFPKQVSSEDSSSLARESRELSSDYASATMQSRG